MNDIDRAGIIYLSRRGVDKDKVARAFGATKREVEETVRKANRKKRAWAYGTSSNVR